MKNKLWAFLLIGLVLLTGCSTKKDDVIKKLTKKIEKMDSYYIEGILEVTNNETTYKYDINVSYKKDDNYRVDLKNQTNSHEQIILKNSDGVYVLTPSLNKSFKFQSEWPYNNSQSYLYQSLLNDIKNDNKKTCDKKGKNYIITTTVNYSNNKDLIKQKIYVDKNLNITKVEVLNKQDIVKIKMIYNKTKNDTNFDKNYFNLDSNMNTTQSAKTTAKISDIIYPLYIPDNTYLKSEDKLDNGKRVILTFSGDKDFTIIEQSASLSNDYTTIPVYGDLEFINDSIGNITDTTASWTSNGIEYYAISDSMDKAELLEVANSVSTIPVGK